MLDLVKPHGGKIFTTRWPQNFLKCGKYLL